MKLKAARVQFDAERQRVTLNGEPLGLQDKAETVLAMIIVSAPSSISRREIINSVWSGNHAVGDRGLNQALWSIRAALGDDARNPRYIRTLPREGYRWIAALESPRRRELRFGFAAAVAACISALALVSFGEPTRSGAEFTLPPQCSLNSKDDVHAYRVRRDVFIDIHEGCRLIVKPSGIKEFGSPLVSDDGRKVAFTVTENQSCRFVTFELDGGKRTEFQGCSVN